MKHYSRMVHPIVYNSAMKRYIWNYQSLYKMAEIPVIAQESLN